MNQSISKGHIAFTENQEFYLRNGEVYRANLSNVFDVDGYRHGRWECSEAHFKIFRTVVLPQEAKP